MKSFWMGVLGSFVGMLLFVSVGIIFGQDIFQVEKDGTPRFKVTADGKIPVGSTGSYEILAIQNNAGNPNARVDISADAITVEAVRLENVSVSATITATGAGGLDTGSEVGSTWYYVWVITNNDGSLSNGLLSASSTSPTVPSGFTKKRRVGAVRNDGSGNFLQFVQEGNMVMYKNAYGVNRLVSAGISTTFVSTPTSGSLFIPPTSRRGMFHVFSAAGHGTVITGLHTRVREAGTSGASGDIAATMYNQNATTWNTSGVVGPCGVSSTQEIEYKIDNAPASGGSFVDVLGYYDRI